HAGRPDEADRQVAACLRARPDDPWVWRARLEVLHLRGDRDALAAAVARLPKAADGDPELWKYRGLARFHDGDYAAAAAAFGKASALDPREPEYVYQLGMAEQRLGRRDEAAGHLLRSRRLREDFERLHEAYVSY